jgi:hypothetical protein
MKERIDHHKDGSFDIARDAANGAHHVLGDVHRLERLDPCRSRTDRSLPALPQTIRPQPGSPANQPV